MMDRDIDCAKCGAATSGAALCGTCAGLNACSAPSDDNMARALRWLSSEPSTVEGKSLYGCALSGPDHFVQASLARLLDQVQACTICPASAAPSSGEAEARETPWPSAAYYKATLEKIAKTPGLPIEAYETAADALGWARRFRPSGDRANELLATGWKWHGQNRWSHPGADSGRPMTYEAARDHLPASPFTSRASPCPGRVVVDDVLLKCSNPKGRGHDGACDFPTALTKGPAK